MPRRGAKLSAMELWHTYRFLRYVADRKKRGESAEHVNVRVEYSEYAKLSGERVSELWGACIDLKFMRLDYNRIDIEVAGRQLLEGRMGPISWGLFAAEMRDHNVVAGAIGGVVGAIIGGLFVLWVQSSVINPTPTASAPTTPIISLSPKTPR
jgi:hypothetical protein